ncbi:MAG: hypothetical protein M3R68_10825, partial [Acidobacteriota bacterium]|nr:hypothetical protein [Acidobacteriota bacterium]
SYVRRWAQSIADLFALSPQRAFGYAGLAAVVLFAITFALVRFRTVTPIQKSLEIAAVRPNSPPASANTPNTTAPASSQNNVTSSQHDVKLRVNSAPVAYRPKRAITQPASALSESAHAKLLPGERSYIKTIAALDTSMKSNHAAPMRPALQSEYERNLAMLDRAIAATRNAAKSNPNDPDAAEFMFAAYQTKVDFLNQVADSRLSNRQH